MGLTLADPRALLAQIEEAAKQLAAFSDDSRSDLGDVLSPSQERLPRLFGALVVQVRPRLT